MGYLIGFPFFLLFPAVKHRYVLFLKWSIPLKGSGIRYKIDVQFRKGVVEEIGSVKGNKLFRSFRRS